MKMLVGEFTGRREALIRELGWGRMWIARGRNIRTYPGEPWGFDNGAFRDWRAGVPFDDRAYLARLDAARAHGYPLLAVIPDLPGRAESLAYSLDWLGRLPEWPWYLAVQDGMRPLDVAKHTHRLSGIFLGGTNAFKSHAREWCEFAHSEGLPFHYGRCGTLGKLEHAREVGADSADSALPMWTKQRWRAFVEHWLHQPQLKLWEGKDARSD